MSKIDLDPITSGYNLSKINANFQKIEDELNNKVLYRNSPAGEPNSMSSNLDMNSKSILNASKISSNVLELGGVQVVPTSLAIDPYNGTREALRRSYAEAGYNLVDGSFEAGGTVTNATDVLLYETEGNAYSYTGTLPHTVAAGSSPSAEPGMWVDRSTAPNAFKQSGTGAVLRTAKGKMGETVTPQDFGAIGDGYAIDGPYIQQALNSGHKAVYAPAGVYLLDDDLVVPAGVELFGAGEGKTIFRMLGRDTHGRNSNLFAKYQSVAISAAPAMIVLVGSNSSAHDFTCDGNGFNNYDDGAIKDYLNETLRHGYAGARIGRLTNRAGASEPASFIENSHLYRITTTLTAWGAFTIVGFGYRFYSGMPTTTDEDLIGAKYCSVRDCTTINTFSNNIALFSARDCAISGNTVINNVHKGIACYTRCRDILISDNTFVYDETTDVSWRDTYSVAYNREAEMGTRSDAIAIGHSDYNTLISNIIVTGNKLRGNGKIRNGISVFSNTSKVKISGNKVTGFVSPLSIGVSNNLVVCDNDLAGNNYTFTDFAVGTVYFGSDIQFSARSVETSKDRPAALCVASFTSNTFYGSGTNHIRGNDWAVWNALDSGLQAIFSGNSYNHQGLSGIGTEVVKPVNINYAPTSSNPSRITFDKDQHINTSGNISDGSLIFFSNTMWSFVRPYGYQFKFTPSVIGGTTSGVATYINGPTGIYTASATSVEFAMEAGWSAHTGAGNLRITGMPIDSKSTVGGNVPSSLNAHCSSLTFSGQLAAVMLNGAATVDFFSLTTGGGLTNIPLDTSVNILRVSGRYFI